MADLNLGLGIIDADSVVLGGLSPWVAGDDTDQEVADKFWQFSISGIRDHVPQAHTHPGLGGAHDFADLTGMISAMQIPGMVIDMSKLDASLQGVITGNTAAALAAQGTAAAASHAASAASMAAALAQGQADMAIMDIGELGLAVDAGGNVYFRRDGSGSDRIHLNASGGGYAYVDRTFNIASFNSALGQIRFGGGDNSDRAGWYLAVRAQNNQSRGQIPADVSNDNWIRIDNDIYPNIGGGQSERLTSLLFRHPAPADAESRIYTIDPIATDAEATDDQGATSSNAYIYTPHQLADVVNAHQSPVHDLLRVARIPTFYEGDLILLDHDYTEGIRDDSTVRFNSSGTFFGWSDGTVFGRSGTTTGGLAPLQFIRATFANGVYTVGQISSPNRAWIASLDKYVSLNVEYDLGPVTTLNGHYVRAVVNGPASANLGTPFTFNLKFTSGNYFLTDGTTVTHYMGEYLWYPDATPAAYDRYDGWLGLTVQDHSSNAFSGIKRLQLHFSLKDFDIPLDSESIGLEVNTAWLQPRIDERVEGWALRANPLLRVPLDRTYGPSIVTVTRSGQVATFHRADGGVSTITLSGGTTVAANPGGAGLADLTSISIAGTGYAIAGGGGIPTWGWAHLTNDDILPGPKLPSDLENVDNSDITYTDATVSSFASRVAQLTTRTGVDSTQGDSYQFQWVDSDMTADKRIAIQVNGGTIRTVVLQDGAGLRRVNLGDLARYNIIEVYRGSGSYHFTGGTREAAGAGGNPDAFVGVSRAAQIVTFTQADGTTETLALPAGGGGGGLTEAEVDARVVAGTLAEARVGDTGRWGAAKMFADTLVGLQVSGNALTLTDVQGGTAGRNLPNAVTGGALTLVGQQLSLQVYRHTGGAISLGSVALPAGGGGGGDDAYGWATVGDTSLMPLDKLPDNTVVGVSYGGGQLVFEYASGIFVPFTLGGGGAGLDLGTATELTVLDNADRVLVADQSDSWANKYMTAEDYAEILRPEVFHGTARIATGPSSFNFDSAHFTISGSNSGVDIQLANVGGGGDDAYGWATVGDLNRIPITKAPGGLLHTVANESYNLLRFTEVGGLQHDITINLPAAGSVIESMLAMHNTPTNAQVVAWDLNNDRMYWANAATDQRIVDLINEHNPTAIPGAVTQTGGGDRGSGPRFAWEQHTHQIVGIQLDDIPGTPITTVPDDARLLVETAGGINRKITGANARTSLGGGGGVIDINGLTQISGATHGDELAIYDKSMGVNYKVPLLAVGVYASKISDFITLTATPADDDWWYYSDISANRTMKRISGADLKTYIGVSGDTPQTEENTRVVEHILDRLTEVDQRVSDIDQTSVADTLAFSTLETMKTVASEPTDADRTTGVYSISLTGFTIGPNETGYLLFRIGIDENPNLYEPQLYDTGGSIIQNLPTLGFVTELSPTATHRYFYRPAYFPLEDTGRLRMRVATRTAHTTWRGSIDGRESFNGEIALTDNVVEVASVTKPASGQLTVRVHGHTDGRLGSIIADVGWIPTRATAPVGIINDATTNIAKFEAANRRIYAVWVGTEANATLYLAAQAEQTYDMVIGHTE